MVRQNTLTRTFTRGFHALSENRIRDLPTRRGKFWVFFFLLDLNLLRMMWFLRRKSDSDPFVTTAPGERALKIWTDFSDVEQP